MTLTVRVILRRFLQFLRIGGAQYVIGPVQFPRVPFTTKPYG